MQNMVFYWDYDDRKVPAHAGALSQSSSGLSQSLHFTDLRESYNSESDLHAVHRVRVRDQRL